MCDDVVQHRLYLISRNVSSIADMWLLMKLIGCWTWDSPSLLRTSLKNHTTLVSKQTSLSNTLP